MEIIQSMFSDDNEIKLDIDDKIAVMYQNIWRFKNIPVNNTWVKEEVSRRVN